MALAPTSNAIHLSSQTPGVITDSNDYAEASNNLIAVKNLKRELVPDNLAISCADCHTKKTPLWRRAENGDILCNACGLFTKTKRVRRKGCKSKVTIEEEEVGGCPSQASKGTCPGDGNCNGTGGAKACDGCPAYHQQNDTKKKMSCFNCHTITTPLWRRDGEGNNICNACGLYYKINNSHRPVTLKTAVIKRRRRMIAPKDKNSPQEVSINDVPPSAENTTESNHEASLPEVPSIEDYPESYFNRDRINLIPASTQSLQFARPKVVLTREIEEIPCVAKASVVSPVESSESATSPFNKHYPGISARHPTPTHSPPFNPKLLPFPTSWSPSIHQTNTSVSYLPSSSSSNAPPVDLNNLLAERQKIQLEIDSLTQHLNNSSAVLSSMKNVLSSIDHIIATQTPAPTLPPTHHSRDQITLPPIQYITGPYSRSSDANYSHPYFYSPRAE